MQIVNQIILLFGLNLLDALLTIFWVRSGVATESNQLMAKLLDIGNFPFLSVKITVGAIAALVLLRFAHRPLARFGVTFSLAVYLGLMCIHLFTGLSAFGYVSANLLERFATTAGTIFAVFF